MAVENYNFWSEEFEEGQDLKNRAAHHHQEPPGHLQRNICLVDTSWDTQKTLTSTWQSVGDSAGD